ncbi:hypothetical protein [Klebsiella pneumoniae]|uniref:hypothetical protein n=1 Tax=Klebsiella pneumoniae TaxID=573 RepID=UPI00283D60BF|nr:hypothetical protein [Klebsiella pneumoniae]MDR4742710.1 hypothetical protein [Klebsiella pneumoniae]
MCTGVEIAAIGASVLAAGGAVYSGQQQKKMSNYQAAQAEADAEASQKAARVEADRIRKAGARQAAAANAAMAASGVETGEGTALRITSGITEDSEQDAYQTILNGVNSSNRLQSQAQADRISGGNAATAGYFNVGSSLLSAGATAYSGWKKSGGSK